MSRGLLAAFALSLVLVPPAPARARTVTVHYATPAALRGLNVSLLLPRLRIAEVKSLDLRALRARPGIEWLEPAHARRQLGSAPQLDLSGARGEWQYRATRANLVPASVRRAAAAITIAVVDTGADVSAPDIAAKHPVTHDAVTGSGAVADTIGHGTFVSSLAAGSPVHGVFAGFGGDARLMIVQANSDANDFTDATEAAAIVWAVDHGANILNLSLGGPDTSQAEQDALDYATQHGVLIVAAAGNGGSHADGPTYPAALLGPNGIAVGASTRSGARASFSTPASYVSLLAPGVDVLGSLSSTAPRSSYPHAHVGSGIGLFGYGTGTSYAAPEVAGAAALVWAANPSLTAAQVVQLLEGTATQARTHAEGDGSGVLDVAAAVAAAQTSTPPGP